MIGRRAHEGHPHKEGHRRPGLPGLRLGPPASDGRPHSHTLLKQEEEPSPRVERQRIPHAFGILDKALNRRASRRDPQGVVRR